MEMTTNKKNMVGQVDLLSSFNLTLFPYFHIFSQEGLSCTGQEYIHLASCSDRLVRLSFIFYH